MCNISTCKQRHDGSYTDTVICAKGSALRTDPVAILEHFDALLVKIKNRVGVFLVHHIEVALKNNGLTVFHSGCCRLFNDDVADGVALRVKAKRMAKVEHKCDDAFFFFRRSRYRIERGEMLPQGFWFNIAEIHY